MRYPFTKKRSEPPIVNNKTNVKVSKNHYVLSKLIFPSLKNRSQVPLWTRNDPLVDKISTYKRKANSQYSTKALRKHWEVLGVLFLKNFKKNSKIWNQPQCSQNVGNHPLGIKRMFVQIWAILRSPKKALGNVESVISNEST